MTQMYFEYKYMETIIGVICAAIVMVSLNRFTEWRRERKEKKERVETKQESMKAEQEEMKSEQEEQAGVMPDTLGLMFNTLNQLGCQPTAIDDSTLSVQYQGENFVMQFGGMYATVWNPRWTGIKVDDPNLPNLRDAVNAANFYFGPTVVITDPDDEGIISLHSRRDIMLHPACPDNVPFVKAVLDSFFETKENVRNNFQQINIQQTENQKNRRPIGFAANSDVE